MLVRKLFLVTVIILLVQISQIIAVTPKTRIMETKFQDLQGKTKTLKSLNSSITIVNFWATWCTPCIKEMPALEKIYKEYKSDNVKVVGIAVLSDTSKIKKMVKVTGVTYPIWIGDRKSIQQFGISSTIPQTFILDSQGNILARFIGSQSYKQFKSKMNELVAEHLLSDALNNSF